MRRVLQLASLCFLGLFLLPALASADKVKQATKWYLKGRTLMGAKKYSSASKAFGRAYRLLPRHPHFNCHRASFLNYQASAFERLRKPYAAMRTYYKAAYRSYCKTKSTTAYPSKRYRYLYRRWMSSIQFTSTPPKARIFQIVGNQDKPMGKTPYKKNFSPGTYRFKVRLYDHKTMYYNLKLKAGMHVTKNFKMVKGDDPVNRPEKVDVAPPPPVAAGGNPSAAPPSQPAPPPERKTTKIALGGDNLSNSETGLNTAGNVDDPLLRKRKKGKPGPPVYTQPWFWGVIGAVVVGGVVVAIVVPKPTTVTISAGAL